MMRSRPRDDARRGFFAVEVCGITCVCLVNLQMDHLLRNFKQGDV